MKFTRYFCTVYLLLLAGSQVTSAQNLRLPITNYSNKVYGRIYDATNSCILTDHRNFIYAGNANGILEYDGAEWRFIPVKQGAYVTSLALSPNGRIYVGSQNEFGVLDISPHGELHYRSLSDSLAEKDRFFSTVWNTMADEQQVIFQSEECIFMLQGGSLKPICPENSFHTAFLVDGRLFARERQGGLYLYQGNIFEPLPDAALFADLGIFAMLPESGEETILIATQEQGFFRLNEEMRITRVDHPKESFIQQAGIIDGINLNDGNLAFATLHEGILVLEQDLRIDAVINRHAGLNVDDVRGIVQDRHDNLWAALEHGISKISYPSALSYYDENAGIEGAVNDVALYGNLIHVATNQGLYRQISTKAINLSLEFEPIAGIRDQVWFLKDLGEALLVGAANGLYLVEGNRSSMISAINAFTYCWLEEESLLLVGGNNGLKAFGPPGHWTKQMDFPDITEDIKTIALNRSSLYDENEIWLGTSYQGAIKVLLNKDGNHQVSRYRGIMDGLPEDWVLPMELEDTLVFGTRIGLLHFEDEEIIKQSLPDSQKENPDFNRGYFEGKALHGVNITAPLNFLTSVNKTTWAVIDNEIGMIRHDNPGKIIQRPFTGIDQGKINRIYLENNSTAWIAASEGLARYELARLHPPFREHRTAIRMVLASGDSILFHGSHPLPVEYSAEDPGILFEQPGDRRPVLEHKLHHLTFYFSTPFYENEERNLFSWMLEGEDTDWSRWDGRRLASYTRLKEGNYTFHVRTMNIYGDISQSTSFAFRILPPWYRTGFAYLVYAILFMLIIYLAVRVGQIRLRRKNEKLEAIVKERTQEIRAQNIELARQKKEITDSINYAEQIQRALLPLPEGIEDHISEYFILFKPKDIVSGDFYWLAVNGDKIIITAADCTGHGVPGAFMSMLGVSFLNKIILENNILQADRILNDLRKNVIHSLKQTGKEGESKDGMDMALVVIDMKEMYMEFAGANNPLYMIRDDELNETKADRMPIGYYLNAGDFANHRIALKKGDCYYLFSDGFPDQFGGPRGKKYKYKAFKELLIAQKHKSMAEQKQILDETLEAWKGHQGPDGKPYEQVDDVLVIGLRI